jgi:hypothetical protein
MRVRMHRGGLLQVGDRVVLTWSGSLGRETRG